MDGKWNVHFGPLDPPDKSVGYDSKSEAIEHAASLVGSTIAPRLRWITDPAGERLPQAEVESLIASLPERPAKR
jgi:hypothetical protein